MIGQISFLYLQQAGKSDTATMKKAYDNIPYHVKSFCSIATEFMLSQHSATSSPIVVHCTSTIRGGLRGVKYHQQLSNLVQAVESEAAGSQIISSLFAGSFLISWSRVLTKIDRSDSDGVTSIKSIVLFVYLLVDMPIYIGILILYAHVLIMDII